MIIGIGLDLIRVRDLPYEFVQANFTQAEQNYVQGLMNGLPQWERYAGILASKEAFKKALGEAFTDIPMLDMEVARDENGRPYISLCCPEKYGHGQANYKIHITLSHTDERAVAMVVIEEHGDTWYNRLFGKKKG